MLRTLTASEKEAVVQSGGGGSIDALVPSSRWQEDEDSLRGVRQVNQNSGALADVTVGRMKVVILKRPGTNAWLRKMLKMFVWICSN